ncbi:MAG: hypothetical protein ABIB97_02525 [Patescibacteria group bacterium]
MCNFFQGSAYKGRKKRRKSNTKPTSSQDGRQDQPRPVSKQAEKSGTGSGMVH